MSNELLAKELELERKNIKTDSYSMSIGELINLYKDDELKLDPAFQRLFRWSDEQKTRFIESILIGIPIPEIFVAQKKDGNWSVVDGVQRISTLLQLTGDLPAHDPLVLKETKYLPSLKDKTWETLSMDVKRLLRRSKLGINIILTENSVKSQYELFQRLNTGGIHLEAQEIRNCLLIMIDESFYEEINQLKNYTPFKTCLSITERQYNIEYHMELILRYLIAKFNRVDYSKYNLSITNINDFIDQEITALMGNEKFDLKLEIDLFKRTFDLLNHMLGESTFKKYDVDSDKFKGSFLMSSYEAILVGVAENLKSFDQMSKAEFKDLIVSMYTDSTYQELSERGVKAISRFKGLNEFSRRYFND